MSATTRPVYFTIICALLIALTASGLIGTTAASLQDGESAFPPSVTVDGEQYLADRLVSLDPALWSRLPNRVG